MTEFCDFALSNNIKLDFASGTGYLDMVNDQTTIKTLNKIMKKGGLLMIDLQIITQYVMR